jgi:hypothetical protein
MSGIWMFSLEQPMVHEAIRPSGTADERRDTPKDDAGVVTLGQGRPPPPMLEVSG